MKTQIQAVLTVVLFILTAGCSSPHSAAQVSDLGPPAISEPPEAIILRFCAETVLPLIGEVIALADQLEPEIERHERSGLTSPGFITEEFSCQDDAVRLMNSFSNCELWALSNDMGTVINLYGEVRAAKLICEAGLETLRNN